jgi:DNA-binding CsgD family transcriptional regulator
MRQYLDGFATKPSIRTATSSGESDEPSKEGYMALLALSHTAGEHRLYLEMLQCLPKGISGLCSLSLRGLMRRTGLSSYSSIRRACLGLVEKLSVDILPGDPGAGESTYRVFEPWQIFARRIAAGMPPYPKEVAGLEQSNVFRMIGENVMRRSDLSRREAQVALLCTEGLSNAAIGKQLNINEKTVKYHLRHIFIKLGVKRRTELVGSLLKEGNDDTRRLPAGVN